MSPRPIPPGDALREGLAGTRPPKTPKAFVRWAGGADELKRAISGLDGPPKRAEYSDVDAYNRDRTKWRTASRQVQRWTTSAGEQRGRTKGPRLTPAAMRVVEQRRADKRLARLKRKGARARLYARLRMKSAGPHKVDDTRDRVMPSGGPGLFIPADELEEVIGDARRHDYDAAMTALEAAFLEEYGLDEDEAEIVEIYRVKVWINGDPEPA